MKNSKRLKGFSLLLTLLGCCFFAIPSLAGQKIYFKGTDYELHVYHIRGRLPGPTVLIIGGIQGDEPGGYLSADSYADIALIKGSLILVPRANLPSIIMNRREINADMNRKFKTHTQRIYEEKVVNILKRLIRESDLLLNLHDGSGFYRPTWISMWKNPMRFGQSIIADAETYYSKKYHRVLHLGDIARKVAARVNRKIRNKEYYFHFNNHNTIYPWTKHPEQRKSATYFALTRCGIPAFGIETSKFLPSTQLKVLYHNLVVNEFLKEFGVVMENPKVYMTPPQLDYLIISVNNSQPIVVFNHQTVPLSSGDTITVKGYKANYTRGITIDLLGHGSRNDFGKAFQIRRDTTVLVRKDRRVFAKIALKVSKGATRPPLMSCEETCPERDIYLLLKVNGKLRACVPQGTIDVIKGDKIELMDVISSKGRLPLKLNLVGFVGNHRHNTGEDRGYVIDTATDLMKRFSRHKEGKLYTVKAGNGRKTFYTFQIVLIQPVLREMILLTPGGWQHYGNGDALILRQGISTLKIGVIQTTPKGLGNLSVEVQGRRYPVPDQLTCNNAMFVPIHKTATRDQSLTIKVLRGNIHVGNVHVTWPMKSDLTGTPEK